MERVKTFLELAVKQGGSDLHLVSGQAPRIRLNGALQGVRFRVLSVEDMERLLEEFMTASQQERLAKDHAIDFAYDAGELGRFRVNVYRHVHGLAAALRLVPTTLQLLENLGIPETVAESILTSTGLTLVTGPTGSGKSTTLAAMVDHINRNRRHHVVTIEDPIEFVHTYQKSVITQRAVGVHAPTFTEALRNALREDPDTILVGEMRDVETIALALTAAETGIQVLGTLHTNGAVRTVERMVHVFPPQRQDQVRSMLAQSLRLVVSQQLVRNAEGNGRLLVAEVLFNTAAAASLIRAGKSHQLGSVIQAGSRAGMQGLDAELKKLVQSGAILGEEAYKHAVDKTQFEHLVSRRESAKGE